MVLPRPHGKKKKDYGVPFSIIDRQLCVVSLAPHHLVPVSCCFSSQESGSSGASILAAMALTQHDASWALTDQSFTGRPWSCFYMCKLDSDQSMCFSSRTLGWAYPIHVSQPFLSRRHTLNWTNDSSAKCLLSLTASSCAWILGPSSSNPELESVLIFFPRGTPKRRPHSAGREDERGRDASWVGELRSVRGWRVAVDSSSINHFRQASEQRCTDSASSPPKSNSQSVRYSIRTGPHN